MLTIVHFDCMPSPLGEMVLASDGDALTGAWFAGQRHQPAHRSCVAPSARTCRSCVVPLAELAEYFAGERSEFGVPLAPAGTPFQRDVWQAIASVSYGETIAYRELAARAGRPESIRAAGAATGRNPLSIIVPCHRIVGADGALTGYAGDLPQAGPARARACRGRSRARGPGSLLAFAHV